LTVVKRRYDDRPEQGRPAVSQLDLASASPAFPAGLVLWLYPRNDRTHTLTEVKEHNRDRLARRQVDKFAERRAQLAVAALQTLAELGYARTSLRDIAQNSEFSHGVLHYYFSDKFELITFCVRQCKTMRHPLRPHRGHRDHRR